MIPENFDRVVLSLLDSNIMKGHLKKELSETLDIPTTSIGDIWLKSTVVEGVVTQELVVVFEEVTIKKENLMKLPFKSIYENTIRFEVGDTFL